MATTRLVVALAASLLLVGALVATRLDRGVEATWLLAVGSAGATLWAGLSFALSGQQPTMLSAGSYFALTATGLLTTGFLFVRAVERRPLT